jgi:hypothetical protein
MMPPSTTSPTTATPPARSSSAARILGVFASPGKTFAELAADPHFILCWCVQIVVGLLFAYELMTRVGAYALARQQLMLGTRTQSLSPEQLDKAIATAATVFKYSMWASPVIAIVFMLVMAAIMMGIANFVLGYETRYKQQVSMVSHAYLVQTLVGLLSVGVLALTASPYSFQLNNPMGSNIGFFLDKSTTPAFLYQLATHLDIFSIWIVVLLALGLSKMGGKKGKFGSALAVVVSLWLLYVLVISGVSAAFA